MRLRREASLGLGLLLALQILLSMLAIALLTRMGPAIERILQENVYSVAAVEEMTALLAAAPVGERAPGQPPEAFDEALRRAEENVTEEAERPLLETIRNTRTAAFSDDLQARLQMIDALRRLSQVNRDSMSRSDIQAKTLGQAGAWASALLGALALGLSILIYRRLRLRIELPIEALRATSHQIRTGNIQARATIHTGPLEIQEIANNFNYLLDEWLKQRQPALPSSTVSDTPDEELRRLIATLIDLVDTPLLVLGARNEQLAANQAALEVEMDAPREHSDAPRLYPGWQRTAISHTSLTLLRYAPDAALEEEA